MDAHITELGAIAMNGNLNVVPLTHTADFHVLKEDESAFFELLAEIGHAVEKEQSEPADRFALQGLLLSSFGNKHRGMSTSKRFPSGLEHHFWSKVLDQLYPQNRGFISVANPSILLTLAERKVLSLYEQANNIAPWDQYEYRRLATAVANIADEFLRRHTGDISGLAPVLSADAPEQADPKLNVGLK